MTFIHELLKNKSRDAVSITTEHSVYDAAQLMIQNKIGSLFVLDKEKQMAGIITERDILRVVSISCEDFSKRLVGDVMTRDVIVAKPDDTIDYAMTVMSERHFRHLPVIEDGRLIGLISIGDVVNATRSKKDYEIRQLKDFIDGKYPL